MMKQLLRFSVVFALAWLCLWGLSQGIRLALGWPLWLVAVALAAAVELVLFVYRYERSGLEETRSKWLIGLRLAALVVLVWILLDPSWIRKVVREKQQEIVVIVDDSASMHLQDEGEQASRRSLAEKGLEESQIVAKLKEGFKVRTVLAARSLRESDETSQEGWRESTDLASALGSVLEEVPPDDLGGVVLLSDGRHNRPARVEEVARRFGILDAPIASIAVGSTKPPRDAAVVNLEAPEAIHLGDRMRVKVEVKFEGYQGQKAKVKLMRGREWLGEQDVSIPSQSHREEVRFAQVPEAGGVGSFQVLIEPLAEERFEDNNSWEFETSITDARTHVLLVESHPRWEFRYLRNLFYGRDKSVHLQWLLLNPDRVEGEAPTRIPASASRPFGEAQATALPANEEEWRKFDVIILGDLGEKELGEETWKILGRCVKERAAMLVLLSGPQAMPHALSEEARQLVPVEMNWGRRTYYGGSGLPFRIGVATAGEGHPIVQQSTGSADDSLMWRTFPELRWRHPLTSLKEGSEVLLVAEQGGKKTVGSEMGFREALEGLSQRRQQEAENALLVVRQTGKGKVALLLTDRTWRLREGSGDVYHHRFWGNLMRWGAGPVLRAGGPTVRLGTSQLTYTPDDVVRLQARLREENLTPVFEEKIVAEVVRDEKVIAKVEMDSVNESNGLHQGAAGPFNEPGLYQVRLVGEEVSRLEELDGEERVIAGFRVVGSRGPIEMAETTLNLPLLQTLADQSGGAVFSCDSLSELPALFLGGKNEREELREISLWSQWPVLLLLFALLTAEWILRRGAGLP